MVARAWQRVEAGQKQKLIPFEAESQVHITAEGQIQLPDAVSRRMQTAQSGLKPK